MLLLALLSILPHDTATRDTFDVCEVQQVYSWCEKPRQHDLQDQEFVLRPQFVQLLFRRWNDRTGTHEIEAWRMAKPTMQYGYVHSRGVHEIRWFDGDVERVVETKSLVHSAADFDSEVLERATFPREWRTDLRRMKGRE